MIWNKLIVAQLYINSLSKCHFLSNSGGIWRRIIYENNTFLWFLFHIEFVIKKSIIVTWLCIPLQFLILIVAELKNARIIVVVTSWMSENYHTANTLCFLYRNSTFLQLSMSLLIFRKKLNTLILGTVNIVKLISW